MKSFVFGVLVLVGLVGLSACSGGGGGGAASANTVSGTLLLPDAYGITLESEDEDSTLTAPLVLPAIQAGVYWTAVGVLTSPGDTVDRVAVSVTAGSYSFSLSFLEVGAGAGTDVDADFTLVTGSGSVAIGSLVGTSNPETTSFNVPQAGQLLIDLSLFNGQVTSWRLDGMVGTGSPASLGRASKRSELIASDRPIARKALQNSTAVQGELVVRARQGVAADAVASLLTSYGLERTRKLSSGSIVVTHRVKGDTINLVDFAAVLTAHPYIEFAAPNWEASHMATPTDPMAFPDEGPSQSWHYDSIRMRSAWEITIGSPSVVVAVVDTGVVLNHPDLTANLIPGYDFVSMTSGGGDPGDAIGDAPDSWHGTHVAGTIAAGWNNGEGGVGVAPGCRILPVRVLGAGGRGTSTAIAEGIRYAAGLPNASQTLPGVTARVINLSLGMDQSAPEVRLAIQAAVAAGCVVFAAAGNDAETGNPVMYPAALPETISVGAVNPYMRRARYSTFNQFVDVCAPGGEVSQEFGIGGGVLSAFAERNGLAISASYSFLQGTSMACPHAAGVAALMLSVDPNLTPTQIRTLMTSNAFDLGTPGKDNEFGFGLIDAYGCVVAAGGGTVAPAPFAVVPVRELVIRKGEDSGALQIRNAGTGTLTASLVATLQYGNETWADVTLEAADGAINLKVTVDRGQGFPGGGVYLAIVFFSTNDPNMQLEAIPLILAEVDRSPYTKPVKVALIDFDTGAVLSELTPTPIAITGGTSASFSFGNTAPGRYILACAADDDESGDIGPGDYIFAGVIEVGPGKISTGLQLTMQQIPEPLS